MILVGNNDPSKRMTAQDVDLLLQCDDITTYTECGWHCIIGYKARTRLVHAHVGSAEELMGIIASRGYRLGGQRLIALTQEERRELSSYRKYR